MNVIDLNRGQSMFSITRRNSNAEEKVSKEDGSGEEGLKDEYRAMVLPIEE